MDFWMDALAVRFGSGFAVKGAVEAMRIPMRARVRANQRKRTDTE